MGKGIQRIHMEKKERERESVCVYREDNGRDNETYLQSFRQSSMDVHLYICATKESQKQAKW